MPQLTATNIYWLLIAVVAFWAFMRFVVAPKKGAPGLRHMFGREPPLALEGVGKEAIATLIADTKALAASRADLRGVVLAGPFAAKMADTRSVVTLIIFCDEPANYSGEEWFKSWPYPARGHAVQDHHIEMRAGVTEHRFRLRGAPPLSLHFVRFETDKAPAHLHAPLLAGVETLDDPTGLADKLVQNWLARLSAQSGDPS